MQYYNFSDQSKKSNLRLQFFDKSLKKEKLLRGEFERVKLSYLQGKIKKRPNSHWFFFCFSSFR